MLIAMKLKCIKVKICYMQLADLLFCQVRFKPLKYMQFSNYL